MTSEHPSRAGPPSPHLSPHITYCSSVEGTRGLVAVRKLQMVIGKGRTRRGVSLASVTVGAWLVEMCTQTAGARLVALVVRAKSDDGMAVGGGLVLAIYNVAVDSGT